MSALRLRALLVAALIPLGVTAACRRQDLAERRFYDQQVQPVLDGFCVGNTSPCHRIDTATGTALGNLDLSSYEAVKKRPDVLRTYGAYALPLLLVKAIPEESVQVAYAGKFHASEVRHAGGKTLSPNSDAFFVLKRWLDGGATRDGLPLVAERRRGQGVCSEVVPADPAAASVDVTSAAYRAYVTDVEPVLQASCSFGTCHGSPQSDFYLTCGTDEAQRRSNFLRATGFLVAPPANVEQSELLLRPLDTRAGGVSHTGGAFFATRDDATWKRLRDWAAGAQASLAALTPARPSAGAAFFTEHVMPVLLRRGCAFETCHSPSGFNDFRLRPGAPGFLSRYAVQRNHETALHEFMSLDSPDPRQSRLIKKNLLPASGGIAHRGGALLEGPGPDTRAPCPPFVAATASAFCTLAEWHRLERADHAASVTDPGVGPVPLAFVSRPPDGDALVEFDTFRGGADLKLADAHLGPGGRLERVDRVRSALGPCAGLAGRTDLDVRGPEWSHDGARLVFSARAGAGAGHDLWLLEVESGACRRLTRDDGRAVGPSRLHNFDAVFAPDGSLVFASTRTGTLTLKRLLPNADLFRVGPDLDFARAEPMTVLTGSELGPAFMHNGQLSFTAEKASPAFYQLSGRRVNWDLTDYHPLIAQRAVSGDTFGKTAPSVGYQQATEIRELLDRNFVFIASDAGARGAGGALATFNRSVGPFEAGRDEVTFLRAVELADPAATGKPGTRGVYRSPYPLLDGEILASYAADVSDPASATPRYDLVAVSPGARTRRMLVPGGAASLVEAALGYRRSGRSLFRNTPQLVFGGRGGQGDPGQAVAHFPDLPMLATLLDANLRRGRNVHALKGAAALKVYEVASPPSTSPGSLQGPEQVFTERRLLGSAPLASDGSLKVRLPARKPLLFEVVDGGGKALLTMQEEHQMGPGEEITPGVPRGLFNAVCGGCHGSVSGQELDIAVSPDALTSASVSLSRDTEPKALR